MTNKEKATELGIKYQTPCHGIGDCEFEARQAALEMAEWKDKQIIEKVIEWLKENCNLGDYLDWHDWEECRIDTDKLIYELEQAMKGGEE